MYQCRLYVDEVGTGDLKPSDNPGERYLSLTGIVTRVDLHQSRFIPEIEQLKADIFKGEAPKIILHRREIVRKERHFSVLRDSDLREKFDASLLRILKSLPYIACTIAMDKKEHLDLYGEWTRNPYHYCLEALIERYVLWMKRNAYVGDVVIEERGKMPDKRVKSAFRGIYECGTFNVPSQIVQRHLSSKEIKFMKKSDNCPAMQVVDLIAHPSVRAMRFERLRQPFPDDFGTKVVDILEKWKYARHPKTLVKIGWGKKWFPK